MPEKPHLKPTIYARVSSSLGSGAGSFLGNPASPLAIVGAIFFGGLLLQFSQAIGHDLGWLLVATNRLLDGAKIYVDDVIEMNPPLFLYLLTPPVAVSRWLDLPEIPSLRIYVALLAAISLTLCNGILKVLIREPEGLIRRYLLALLTLVLVVDIRHSFGQREHFMVILVAPYLLAMTAHLLARELPRGLALLAGVAAGLAVSVKPHYALLLVALELYLALRRRSLRAWLRPDLLTAVAVAIAYALSVLLLTPSYLSFVFPLGLDTYWIYQKPLAELLHGTDLAAFPLTLIAVLAVRKSRALRELGWVLLITAVCSYILSRLQGTGWEYHLIPFKSAVILALPLPLLALLRRLPPRETPSGPIAGGLAAALMALLALGVLLFALPNTRNTLLKGADWRAGRTRGPIAIVHQVIDRHAKGGTVMFFTAALTGAFPTVNYAEVGFSSRFSCLWPVVAVVRSRAEGGESLSPAKRERMAEIERYMIDSVIEDLERRPPDLIFVDRKEFSSRLTRTPLRLPGVLPARPALPEDLEPLPTLERRGTAPGVPSEAGRAGIPRHRLRPGRASQPPALRHGHPAPGQPAALRQPRGGHFGGGAPGQPGHPVREGLRPEHLDARLRRLDSDRRLSRRTRRRNSTRHPVGCGGPAPGALENTRVRYCVHRHEPQRRVLLRLRPGLRLLHRAVSTHPRWRLRIGPRDLRPLRARSHGGPSSGSKARPARSSCSSSPSIPTGPTSPPNASTATAATTGAT